MNIERFRELIDKINEIEKQKFTIKNKEYASTENVFENFITASKLNLKNDNYSGKMHVEAFRYAKKHLISCLDIIAEPEEFYPVEIEEKFGDLILYLKIIYIMLTNQDDL